MDKTEINFDGNMSEMFSQSDSNFTVSEREKDSFMAGDNAIFDYDTSRASSKSDTSDRFSTKIFVGGIPLGTTDAFIRQCFGAYDHCDVSWPGKRDCADTPPNGYCFIRFRHQEAVKAVLNACNQRDGKYSFSLGRRRDLVQIRPWRISDSTYTVSSNWSRFVRLSVFVGGLPRTLKAIELFGLVQQRFGNVLHCSMELEFDSSYPKGAARVIFGDINSYRAAATAGYVEHQWYPTRHYNLGFVEFKPFIFKNIECEHCGNTNMKTEFCTGNECLLYYCAQCYDQIHKSNGWFAGHERSDVVPRDLPNPCRADLQAKEERDRAEQSMSKDLFRFPPPNFTQFDIREHEMTTSMESTRLEGNTKENKRSTVEMVKDNIEKRPRKFGNLLRSYGVDL